MTAAVPRNFADVWEVVAGRLPEAPALRHGPLVRTWAELDARADALGWALLDAGLGPQAKVAQYLHNVPEYMESVAAAFKAGLVPVNTNHRYTAAELAYLWDDADVEAVVFHGTFAPVADEARGEVPDVTAWLWVDDGSGPCPPWATPYEDALAAARATGRGRCVPPAGRSGDDLLLLYTGGTTGYPKGVMWRQDDLFAVLASTAKVRYPPDLPLDRMGEMLTGPGPRCLPACPLMHGTGLFAAMGALLAGGSVVTLEGRRFDPVELLDTVEEARIQSTAIVGDAFARPLLAALDAQPDRWDISSLRVVASSGVMWSAEVKQGLLRHNPRMLLVDQLGSSEAVGMASSVSTGTDAVGTARFTLSDRCRVVTDDDRFVEPGSGEVGLVALKGPTSSGYYKDPMKSAATYRVIGGERWSIPGDAARVEADGTLVLLGRGSNCVNTGGEKVFPEEVEEALKRDPRVADAVVVGAPDERLGQRVVAAVELHAGAAGAAGDAGDAGDVELVPSLLAGVREGLAGYKVPKQLHVVDSIGRAANGKVDYRLWRERLGG